MKRILSLKSHGPKTWVIFDFVNQGESVDENDPQEPSEMMDPAQLLLCSDAGQTSGP